MHLEGASWDFDKIMLKEQDLGELSIEMPVIWLEPVSVSKLKKIGFYECPLYKTSKRQGELSTTGHSTNFVLMVELPTEEDEAKWIKAGVAMFLALKQ